MRHPSPAATTPGGIRYRPAVDVAYVIGRPYRTVADVALVTGRPHRTIRTWARTGQIPAVKHGDRLLVDLVAAKRLSDATPRRRRRRADEG